jgi:glycolate oxidase iron-sulfur subunit
MQHSIQVEEISLEYGLNAAGMLGAIEACVHCGFCLATCPTYQVMGEEMDSPRGRILLMKNALEHNLTIKETMLFIDRCLGCLACVTACPSGVQYDQLLHPYRSQARQLSGLGVMRSVQRGLVEHTLPYPGRFRLAARVGKLVQPLAKWLPGELRGMLSLLPHDLSDDQPLPVLVPAEGERRRRVALLSGCVQQVLDQEINWASIRVLARNGVEVVIPVDQVCCGAILYHCGDTDGARRLARQNLRAFSGDFDAILTNAAGCGSGLKEYPKLFLGQPEEERARHLSENVMDISVFLAELGIEKPPAHKPLKVAYQDACHLAHAQGVTEAPRKLLQLIPDITLMPIVEAELCCGSAGTYNLDQPELADEIGMRKAENILSSGCNMVVTGNIGCMVQLRRQLQRCGSHLAVYHTLQLIDMVYDGTG